MMRCGCEPLPFEDLGVTPDKINLNDNRTLDEITVVINFLAFGDRLAYFKDQQNLELVPVDGDQTVPRLDKVVLGNNKFFQLLDQRRTQSHNFRKLGLLTTELYEALCFKCGSDVLYNPEYMEILEGQDINCDYDKVVHMICTPRKMDGVPCYKCTWTIDAGRLPEIADYLLSNLLFT